MEQYGYPFKSKEHSDRLSVYQHSGKTDYVRGYLGETGKTHFVCPDRLKYQFTENYPLKVSKQCCYKLKKDVAAKWSRENHRPIVITGMRQDEGGNRANLSGCAILTDGQLHKFHPLLVADDAFVEWYIESRHVQLCELYYPPYNFKRTGCKGCPYALDLQRQLDIMAVYLPEERRQCEQIWGKVYQEYRRIHYRLEPTLFDGL